MSRYVFLDLIVCLRSVYVVIETESNIVCNDVTLPENGTVSYSENRDHGNGTRRIGTIATYSCNTGYILIGGITRTCQSAANDSGAWSGQDLTCKGGPASFSLFVKNVIYHIAEKFGKHYVWSIR